MDNSRRRWWALGLLCIAQFVNVLDVNAVVVALPVIGSELGFDSSGQLQWVVTAYALAFGGCLLLAGRLADLYGARRMFVAGLAAFTVASLLCGLAPTPLALVVLRGLQGLGAAIVAPAALSLITSMFATGRERSLAMGVWTAVAAGGGAAGLLLGGVITGLLGWRWVFFVNVPVGVAGMALSYVLLRGGRPTPSTTRLDVPGAVTVTAGLLLLVYALTLAESSGFGTPSTVGVAALAVLLLAVFVLVERTSSAPLVPLRIFTNRGLTGSTLASFTNTATTSPIAILTVLYLQNVLGYSPVAAGLLALPLSLAVIAGSFVGSRLTVRAGASRTMALGLLLIAAGSLILLGISAETGVADVLPGTALAGLGLGCSAVAATTHGTSALAAQDRGLAAGLLNSAAQIGTAIGLAGLIWVAAAASSAAGGSTAEAATVTGYRWAFVVAAAFAVLAAVVVLRLLRRRDGRPSPSAPRNRSTIVRSIRTSLSASKPPSAAMK